MKSWRMLQRLGLVLCGLGCISACSSKSPFPSGDEKGSATSIASTESVAVKEEKKSSAKAPEAKPPEFPIDTSLQVDSLLTARLPEEELALGWIRLFDGQSLFGWKKSSDANWRVEEGTIVVDGGEPGFLQTTSHFADFELQLEYQSPAKTNSGVFLRSALNPTDPAKDCIELNIAPVDNPFPTGSLVQRQKVEPTVLGDIAHDEWHQMHVLVDGDRVQVWFDGKVAADIRDTSGLVSGVIGLQYREGGIRFRNIRLRPILLNTAIPNHDPGKWLMDDASRGMFTFNDAGELLIQGGKGQIEWARPFADFCLQAEVKTEAPKTNSGIFFRCIPNEPLMGYECQIGHEYDSDRRRPSDFGMGGIFRRQPARAVLSDESAWSYITIAVRENHFATWVQGIQVTDWVDERESHENPRNGLRLEAGSIMLQAHDAECRAHFRKLKVMELDASKLKRPAGP